MKVIGRFLMLVLTVLAALAGRAQGQGPHIAYAYPAGGRLGTSFAITVGGQNIQGVSNAYVSGDGIQAVVVEHRRPMPQSEFNDLREELRKLQDKRRDGSLTDAESKAMQEIRDKIIKNPPNRTVSPALAQTAIIRVTISSNAEPGAHEIRLKSPVGLSNPLKFYVDQLPEISKPAAQSPNPDFERALEKFGAPAPAKSSITEMRMTLPTIVNGQIMPAGVDRYHFYARQGQQLVFRVLARDLIPYLADAVPGWFEATLAIYDSKGAELAYAERFRFEPDPVLHFAVPKEGDYVLEIKDSIYRGREDFVYRMEAGELPFVTYIFPLGGQAGTTTKVHLNGWNLPVTDITVTNDENENGIHALILPGLRPGKFAVDSLPESTAKNARRTVKLPIIINGVIEKPGDTREFRFAGTAGMELVAEVIARRLNSPLDSTLELLDRSGHRLAFNDDFDDKSSGLETHHADSYLKAILPSDGTYSIRLTDAQHHGGPDYAYRLRLSKPHPDFALRVTPSSLGVRAGLSVALTVTAIRKDGFTNAIDLRLKDAPNGFVLTGGRVPARQDEARCTLQAPPAFMGRMIDLTLEGRARIDDASVTHAALPAEDMMQAFAYRHLVPAQNLAVAVLYNPRPNASQAIRILTHTPLKVSAGQPTLVRFATPSSTFVERFEIDLTGAPDGISLGKVSPTDDGVELALNCDGAKIKPGLSGNIIFNIVPKNRGTAKNSKRNNARRGEGAALPAIPFETVE